MSTMSLLLAAASCCLLLLLTAKIRFSPWTSGQMVISPRFAQYQTLQKTWNQIVLLSM